MILPVMAVAVDMVPVPVRSTPRMQWRCVVVHEGRGLSLDEGGDSIKGILTIKEASRDMESDNDSGREAEESKNSERLDIGGEREKGKKVRSRSRRLKMRAGPDNLTTHHVTKHSIGGLAGKPSQAMCGTFR